MCEKSFGEDVFEFSSSLSFPGDFTFTFSFFYHILPQYCLSSLLVMVFTFLLSKDEKGQKAANCWPLWFRTGLGLLRRIKRTVKSGRSQTNSEPTFIRTRLICMHSHKGSYVCFFSACFCFLSLLNIVWFGKTILHHCWELSLFILISGHTLMSNPNVHACVHRC